MKESNSLENIFHNETVPTIDIFTYSEVYKNNIKLMKYFNSLL